MRFLKVNFIRESYVTYVRTINKKYRDKSISASDKMLLGDIPMGFVLTEGKQPAHVKEVVSGVCMCMRACVFVCV